MQRHLSDRSAKEEILAWGAELGFANVGIAPPETPRRGEFFAEWIRRGFQASMHYLAKEPERRIDPERILEGCRSVIVVRMDYGGREVDPAAGDPTLGRISRYAWGDDYHDLLKTRLKRLAARVIDRWPSARIRIAVDTSPVLEKGFAVEAGIGWMGKHTNLIDARSGSWFFVGELFTTLDLEPDRAVTDQCGSCLRCIDACPTNAIVEPYVLDARRCLAYWNIEHRGPIDRAFHKPMGNWIFGCDLCQEVCPWNRRVAQRTEILLAPRERNLGRSLSEWNGLSIEEFRDRFRRSAVKRARHDGFQRNVEVATANARDAGEEQRGKP